MRLYTYIIPIDDGAAPNPYGGFCTLNICKPRIRSSAQVGDWVAAFGSKNVEGCGDLSRKLIYAMWTRWTRLISPSSTQSIKRG